MRAKPLLVLGTVALLLGLVMAGYAAAAEVEDEDGDGLVDDWESKHGYDNDTKDNPLEEKGVEDYRRNPLYTFLYVSILSFGAFSLVLGAFTTRFATGRSRVTGAILLLVGIATGLIFLLFSVLEIRKYPDDTVIPEYGLIHWQAQLVLMPFFTIVAFGLGAFLALVFFLVIIMKA